MSANNAKVQAVIESTFNLAIKKLVAKDTGNSYSDLYVQVDAESGELQIYDESESLVEKTIIFDWVNAKNDNKQFIQQVIATLKAVLAVLVTKNVFENSCFLKPFSVSLTNDDFSVIEELLFLDDENLLLDDPLLKDLDADLDDFLTKLLSDVK
ncbi:MAG: hypothetical protein E7085_07635 [Parabacteroides distasonis]|nr:hypothetical protein [Parabacteroides distasonis]